MDELIDYWHVTRTNMLLYQNLTDSSELSGVEMFFLLSHCHPTTCCKAQVTSWAVQAPAIAHGVEIFPDESQKVLD